MKTFSQNHQTCFIFVRSFRSSLACSFTSVLSLCVWAPACDPCCFLYHPPPTLASVIPSKVLHDLYSCPLARSSLPPSRALTYIHMVSSSIFSRRSLAGDTLYFPVGVPRSAAKHPVTSECQNFSDSSPRQIWAPGLPLPVGSDR